MEFSSLSAQSLLNQGLVSLAQRRGQEEGLRSMAVEERLKMLMRSLSGSQHELLLSMGLMLGYYTKSMLHGDWSCLSNTD